jgi:hypothetical protein
MKIDRTETATNVISLDSARNRHSFGKCKHLPIVVNEKLNTVECDDCGAKLNPVAMLARMAEEESMWKRNLERMRELGEELKTRKRCKCEHCGNMTNIRPRRK